MMFVLAKSFTDTNVVLLFSSSSDIVSSKIVEQTYDCKPNQLTCKEKQLNLPKSVNLFQVRSFFLLQNDSFHPFSYL